MPTTSFNVLNTIIKIAKRSKDTGLDESRMDSIQGDLARLSGYLEMDETEALFFAVIFSLSHMQRDYTNMNDLAEHFNVHALKILQYYKMLEDMSRKNLLDSTIPRRRRGRSGIADRVFSIPDHLLKAVVENREPAREDDHTQKDFVGFLEDLTALIEERTVEILTTSELMKEAEALLDHYEEVEEIGKINQLNMPLEETVIFFYVCKNTLDGMKEINAELPVEEIFDNLRRQYRYKNKIFQAEGPLFDYELLELGHESFRNKQHVRLTKKSMEMMFGDEISVFHNQEQVENLVTPDSIHEKQLFYNPEESERVSFLRDMLQPEKLGSLQSRLQEKNMPTGVTVLFHGNPGTGKTETVHQLARQTGREIIHVNLSDTKSKWFGESEKKVKEIFDSYNDYITKQEQLPILLFNEADALFSKRRDIHATNTAQTENAIQNILLEEMESFRGILVATTNMTMNLDQAFERRFLYKILFRPPSAEVKKQIWQSKLEGLHEEEYGRLARRYDFSGGQIDNIARKVVTEEVLYNQKPGMEKIIRHCEDERLQKERNRIGYIKEKNRVL